MLHVVLKCDPNIIIIFMVLVSIFNFNFLPSIYYDVTNFLYYDVTNFLYYDVTNFLYYDVTLLKGDGGNKITMQYFRKKSCSDGCCLFFFLSFFFSYFSFSPFLSLFCLSLILIFFSLFSLLLFVPTPPSLSPLCI